jgi:hypothetical protein
MYSYSQRGGIMSEVETHNALTDVLYKTMPFDEGDHILVFKFDGRDYTFSHKIFVPKSEFRCNE